jgi:hypothetical protein
VRVDDDRLAEELRSLQRLPRIANYWPRETVARLMREAELEDVTMTWVNEMSWPAIGTKPPSQGQGTAR